MKVKQEVKELCVKLIEACQSNDTEEFKRIEKILKDKGKFNLWMEVRELLKSILKIVT